MRGRELSSAREMWLCGIMGIGWRTGLHLSRYRDAYPATDQSACNITLWLVGERDRDLVAEKGLGPAQSKRIGCEAIN